MKLLLQLLFIDGRRCAGTFACLFLLDAFLQHKRGEMKGNFSAAQRRTAACCDVITLEQSWGRDPQMHLAKQLTYLWRGTEKDFCYLYIRALGSILEARFTGIQQYLAVPFTPSREETRKNKPVSSLCGYSLSSVWSAPWGKSQGFECSVSKHWEQTLSICKNRRAYS